MTLDLWEQINDYLTNISCIKIRLNATINFQHVILCKYKQDSTICCFILIVRKSKIDIQLARNGKNKQIREQYVMQMIFRKDFVKYFRID